jgi:hypothetical protein
MGAKPPRPADRIFELLYRAASSFPLEERAPQLVVECEEIYIYTNKDVYSSDMPPDSSSGHVHLHHNDPSIDEDA